MSAVREVDLAVDPIEVALNAAYPPVNVYEHPETREVVADYKGETRSWYSVLSDIVVSGGKGYTKPCGCRKNLGGWSVSNCPTHQAELDASLKDAKCDHGRSLELGCGMCRVEGEEKQREDERNYRESVQ